MIDTIKDKTTALSSEQKRSLLAQLLRERANQPQHFPLSFAQQRMWFLDQLEPGGPTNIVFTAVRLSGPLSQTAFEESLNEIIRRHETLRTTFALVDGEPMQVIVPRSHLEMTVIDLSRLSADEKDAAALRLSSAEAQRPFDLSSGPLLRASLLQLAEQEHVLFLAMHHIVADGWSMNIFIHELTILYRAYSTGEASPLPSLEIQYADFAQWQRNWLQGDVLQSQLAYWKEKLQGVSVLELPTDRTRPAVQSYRGATQSFVISKRVTEGLKELSQQEGVTLFMTLLAAFQVLLSRYSGQEDIVVGTPIANRNRAEVENLIGFFVNTLVLRTAVSGELSFRELLARVREVCLGAYGHQDVPFEKLVEELQPERSLSRNPLFQVMFSMQNTSAESGELAGLKLSSFAAGNQATTVTFDLTLSIEEHAENLSAAFLYGTDLFDAVTIESMVGHLRSLLEGIISKPDQCLSDVPLLSEAERRQLLEEWNGAGREYPSKHCIHQLFEEQVERTPQALALCYEDQRLTYHELNRRANQLAHYLRRLGVGPEVLVGICMERSVEMVVAILGTLKAGGAYLPLDPSYPAQRLSFMLADAAAQLLLTQEELVPALPEHQALVVCVDAEWAAISRHSGENPVCRTTPENLAYVIYTSGSTGEPKGALISHRNVQRLFEATRSWFDFDENDVWTLFHSYAFDFSVWELWGALLHGGRLVIVPDWVRRSPATFYKLLCEEQVTVLSQTPSAFRQLMQAEETAGSRAELALRFVIFGGEALEIQSLKPWFERHGEVRPQLVNMYGITETTVHVTYRALTMSDVNKSTGSIIGKPMPDLQVYVLDPKQQPVPVGIPGELYVGGAGLSRNYLNRSELTAERFIPDPFSGEVGARLYKSGDLARYLPNGDLEFLGRMDEQVKVRGYRIESGDIEAALNKCPGVRESVVTLHEDGHNDQQLVAYVVETDSGSLTTTRLHGFLKDLLPDYMVPALFVMLDILPLTANGKVDKRALPAPGQSRPELADAYVGPRSGIEEVLVGIWSEVLHVEQVGIFDNFFELGGHSLLATQVVSRVQDAFQIEVPLRSVFDEPAVAGFAVLMVQNLFEQEGDEDFAQLLQEVELLPEDQIKDLLKQDQKEGAEFCSSFQVNSALPHLAG